MCGNREYRGNFQNKLVSSSFRWVPRYTLFLAKLKGKGRPFWSGKALTNPLKYNLKCGSNVNYHKSVHYPIPTGGNREHTGNFWSKSVSSTIECPGIFSSWPNWRGEEGLFGRRKKVGGTLWDYRQEHLVVIRDEKISPFVKPEIILLLLWLLLDTLTNKDCRTWSSMINLWIDSRNCQK